MTCDANEPDRGPGSPPQGVNSRWGLCLVVLLALGADAAVPVIPERVRSSVRQRVDAGYNQGIVVGMVHRDGREFFAYGTTHLGLQRTPDADTLFEIGSITKVFTALLLAEAVQSGELAFDQRVQDLMGPDVTVPRRSTEITLEQLATHRSGLPANPDNVCTDPVRPFECYDLPRLTAFLNGHSLAREPGTGWEYSNLGVGLLGEALARRAGQTYERLLTERILNPLGLRDTLGLVPSPPPLRLAQGHSGVLVRPEFRMGSLEAAGILRSTAAEMLTFLEHQLGIRTSPLSPTLAETRRRRAATAIPGVDMGLGWLLWSLPGGQVLQHDGATPGQTACIALHPGRGVGAVVLSNSRVNTYAGVTDLCLNLLDPAYPLTSIRKPAVVPDDTLRRHAGLYQGSDGDLFGVSWSPGRLVLRHYRSQFDFTAYPESAIRFFAPDLELGTGASARFLTDASGGVVGLDWLQGGATTRYQRRADPPGLQVVSVQDGLRLELDGDLEAPYTLARSGNLTDWELLGRPLPGTRVYPLPGTPPDPAFFRVTVHAGDLPAPALPWRNGHSGPFRQ